MPAVPASVQAACSFLMMVTIFNGLIPQSPCSSGTDPNDSWSFGICQDSAGASYAVRSLHLNKDVDQLEGIQKGAALMF